MARILEIGKEWVRKQSWDFRSGFGERFQALSVSEL